jgi:hypothetical protein
MSTEARDGPGPEVFVLKIKTGDLRYTDLPPAHRVVGDQVVSNGRVFDSKNRTIGRAESIGTVTRRRPYLLLLTVVFTLRGGQIDAQGVAPFETTKPIALPVLGGTGRFLEVVRGRVELSGGRRDGSGRAVFTLVRG